VLAAATAPAPAQDSAPRFTAVQADQGAQVYAEHCASCHGPNLNDGSFGPALKGASFRRDWGGKSVSAAAGSQPLAASGEGGAEVLPQ